MNKKINDLVKYQDKLKALDALKGRKAAKSTSEKELCLSEIVQILQASDTSIHKVFFYESELALIKAQQSLIELGFHCLMFAPNVKYEQRHYYYTILTLIFLRGELKLQQIGFTDDIEQEDHKVVSHNV